MIAELFSTVAPVFACASLGFLWARLKQPYDTRIVTRLVSMIGAPCLIFSTLVTIDGLSLDIGYMAFAAIVAIAIFALVGSVILKASGLPLRTFLAPISFPNAGNMGLPLCLFAFGDEGLALGIGFFAVSATLQLVLGQWLFSGLPTPVPLLKAPIPYAVAIGAVLMVLDVNPPVFVTNTTSLLGNFTIPLMMITLGVSLARMKVVRLRRSFALSALRLGLGALVGFALAEVLGFEGVARGVLIIQCTMPVAVFNYLFAQYYERDPEEVASLVVLSSAMAFALLPLIVFAAT